MGAEALSGKYDYNGLKNTLRRNGVTAGEMHNALRQVAKDNHIDNIKDLDKSKEIKISKSIFENTQDANGVSTLIPFGATNPFAPNQNELLMPIMNPIIISDSNEPLPEIYNDDEYEVVEYDDYYNFNANQMIQREVLNTGIKADNMTPIEVLNAQEFLRMAEAGEVTFTPEDIENAKRTIDGFASDAYLVGNAPFRAPFGKDPLFIENNPIAMNLNASFSPFSPFEQNYSQDVNDKDREDLLEGSMEMNMNMSGNSFDA